MTGTEAITMEIQAWDDLGKVAGWIRDFTYVLKYLHEFEIQRNVKGVFKTLCVCCGGCKGQQERRASKAVQIK